MLHASYKTKDPKPELFESLLNFHIFSISIWYNQNNQPDRIEIMWKITINKLVIILKQPFNKVITIFVVNIVFQHVRIAWIVEYKTNPMFYFQKLCPSWLCNVPQYKTTLCLQFHGYSLENSFNTGKKEIYDIMCAIDAYDKQHPPIEPQNTSNSGGRNLPSNSSTQALGSLVKN